MHTKIYNWALAARLLLTLACCMVVGHAWAQSPTTASLATAGHAVAQSSASASPASTSPALAVGWPEVRTEMRPGARWWWMGSAVDTANLTRRLVDYARAGLGTMEITPIYGVKGNEARELSFLSPAWMQALRHTQDVSSRLGMLVDMNTGTGWPFGGPEVSLDDAASRLLTEEYHLTKGQTLDQPVQTSEAKQQPVARLERLMAYRLDANGQTDRVLDLTAKVDSTGRLHWTAPRGHWRLIAAFCGKTLQKVKRAAPGGEGYVLDHLSHAAVSRYLSRFDRAFGWEADSTAAPHNFFNDSYEVYRADWTPGLFDAFFQRRGYRLEDHLPEFLSEGEQRTDLARRVVSDYRQTMAELLLENFTRQWTDWAHRHGSLTRNQAHGSPGNLIDLYATVDVPECEGYGLSDFGIRGLRRDTLTRKNDSDLSMLKYASSAAHISGRKLTSSETFTWLTEHFRTSLSQCKPDLDLMFVAGVNHVYFHGTTYSPDDVPWPGWKFYASIDMSPTNSIWRDAPAFFRYITRCQSFLQMGQPDNDLLVYLPVYDMWHEQDGRLLMFDIHHMAQRAPRFIQAVDRIAAAGYDMDYVSDAFLLTATCRDGHILTSGGASYRALVVPGVRIMPHDVLAHLLDLAREGATIVFLDRYPETVPGLAEADKRQKAFDRSLQGLRSLQGTQVVFGTDYAATLAQTAAQPEPMKAEHGLSYIRRASATGHHYFIAALQARDTQAWIPLAVPAWQAVFFDPMDGRVGRAPLRWRDGRAEVYLNLASGQSVILQTFDTDAPLTLAGGETTHPVASQTIADGKRTSLPDWPVYTAHPVLTAQGLTGPWHLTFLQSEPHVEAVPDSVPLGSWTDLGIEGAQTTMATARYATTIRLNASDLAADDWLLILGDVRESARVRLNGQPVATLWALPFSCHVGAYLHEGDNLLEVDVTNLPANRIADMDRQGQVWRIFKDANISTLSATRRSDYSQWAPMPSGLLGPVTLIPLAVTQP